MIFEFEFHINLLKIFCVLVDRMFEYHSHFGAWVGRYLILKSFNNVWDIKAFTHSGNMYSLVSKKYKNDFNEAMPASFSFHFRPLGMIKYLGFHHALFVI